MESRMPNPTKIEVNCATGETLEVELTNEEVAQLEADRVTYEAQKAEEEAVAAARAEAKAELLDRLGLTAEDAELLLS
jgi:hypothetical protein